MKTVWILTVAIFTNGENTIQTQQQFENLADCVEVSRQHVAAHGNDRQLDSTHITASCVSQEIKESK